MPPQKTGHIILLRHVLFVMALMFVRNSVTPKEKNRPLAAAKTTRNRLRLTERVRYHEQLRNGDQHAAHGKRNRVEEREIP